MRTPRRLVAVCGAAVAIALPAPLQSQDFWSSLGFGEEDIKSTAFSAFAGGDFNAPSVPKLRAMPGSSRSSLITTAAAWAKRWAQTPEFAKRYAELRDSRKPEMPAEAMTTAQRKAHDKAQIAQSLVQLDSALDRMKGMPEAQKSIQDMKQQLRDQARAIDDPANPMYSKDVEVAYAQQYAAERADYAAKVKAWEASFPASPAAAIRVHLREFIALAQSVDFSAKVTKNEYGKFVFVNADYESKPGEWKALYRAGRETTRALQEAAQQWLGELK